MDATPVTLRFAVSTSVSRLEFDGISLSSSPATGQGGTGFRRDAKRNVDPGVRPDLLALRHSSVEPGRGLRDRSQRIETELVEIEG
jgi:hypothetical protein